MMPFVNNLIQYDEYLVDRYIDDMVDMSKYIDTNFVLEVPVVITKLTHHLLSDFINHHLHKEFMLGKEDLNKSGVYVIKNLTDGRFYVGQSIHVYDRIMQHFSGSDYKDMNAELYSGGQVFAVNFIYCESKDLNRLEREYIKKYDAVENGYNGNYGYK